MLSSECEDAVENDVGDTLMFPKRIVCGLESIKNRVLFEMYAEYIPDEKEKDKDARFAEWEVDGGIQYIEQYASVEEFIPWMLDECQRLNSDDEKRLKIRAIGCWITAGELFSGHTGRKYN